MSDEKRMIKRKETISKKFNKNVGKRGKQEINNALSFALYITIIRLGKGIRCIPDKRRMNVEAFRE